MTSWNQNPRPRSGGVDALRPVVLWSLLLISPCAAGMIASYYEVSSPMLVGVLIVLGVAFLLIWVFKQAETLVEYSRSSKHRVMMHGEKCHHCGYLIPPGGAEKPCTECGKLPYDLDDRGNFVINLACQGCGRHLVELPTGDSCPHCGHQLAWAQAVELVRRKNAVEARRKAGEQQVEARR